MLPSLSKQMFLFFTHQQAEDTVQISFKYIPFRKDLPLLNFSKKDFVEKGTAQTIPCKTPNDLWSAYEKISNLINIIKQPNDLFDIKFLIKAKGKMKRDEINVKFDNLEDFKAYLNIYRMTDNWLDRCCGPV